MINLYNFYIENIKKDNYYYRFYEFITNDNLSKQSKEIEEIFGISNYTYEDKIREYEIYDEEEAIKKLRDLCEPNLSIDEYYKKVFYLICYFLNYNDYEIEEYPRMLERPPVEPTDFIINDIRNRAFKLGLNDGNTIHYNTRRKIVSNLNFFQKKKKSIKIDEDINSMFQFISTRNARFESMSTDEKIKEILNLIENLLKIDGKYIEFNFEKFSLGAITELEVKEFKNKIQCFRHSSNESIQERKSFSDNEKKFIIDYGILICNLIYYNKQDYSAE